MKTRIGAITSSLISICSGFEKFGSYVLVGMVILTTVDITLRRLFNSPFPFTYELIEFMLVLVAYSYIPFTTSLGRHVSMDTLTSHFPAAIRKTVVLAGDFLTVILFGLISWQNVLQGINVLNQGATTAILHVPKYPFQFMVALGSALACLVFLSRTLKSMLVKEAK